MHSAGDFGVMTTGITATEAQKENSGTNCFKGQMHFSGNLFTHSILAGLVQLALGDQHSMILKRDGSVWSTVITLDVLAPALDGSKDFEQVLAGGATAAAAGIRYSMVLKQDGTVWTSRKNTRARVG